VLEAAIVKDPDRPELHHDLLAIYKSSETRMPFLAMRQQLNTDANPVADAWWELTTFFAEES
jgi:hypothetical protein